MKERLSRKEAEDEANVIRVLTGERNISREFYDSADKIVDNIKNDILPRAIELEEIKKLRHLKFSEAKKAMIPILKREFPYLEPLSPENTALRVIIHLVYRALNPYFDKEAERIPSHEFSAEEIISKISEADGWQASELKVEKTYKDSAGNVTSLVIKPQKEEMAIERFGKYVVYVMQYPTKSKETGEIDEESPIIERFLATSGLAELEEKDRIGEFRDIDKDKLEEMVLEHIEDSEILFEYEHGIWYKRNFS